VVHEDNLVEAFECIVTEKFTPARREADLFVDFTQHGIVRMLCLLEKTGHESVPSRRPTDAAHQYNLIVVFDDGRNHWRGIVPVDESTLGLRTSQSLASPTFSAYESMA